MRASESDAGIGGGSAGVAHTLARLSRSELCARLEAQSGDLADLRGLVTPFKVENVRLSRSLKRSRQQIQEVLGALRDFFADPTRREWFRERKDDVALCGFFQRLIAWYRSVCEEDNPTIAFYQKVWEYERGDDFRPAEPSETPSDAPSEAPSTVGAGSARPSTTGSGSADVGGRPSSTTLYDACRERTENLRLQEENARLRQENASLHRMNESLEKEIQGLVQASPDGRGGADGSRGSAAGRPQAGARARPKPVRTLGKLAAADARWERLLRDPDRLFSADDIIDEMYEQYLSEVLSIMERNDYSFKRAIEISETGHGAAGDGSAGAHGAADGPQIPGGPSVQGLGPPVSSQGLGAGVSPELMQQRG